jgi:DNA-binding beta-propeller fold protein YncE
MRYLVPVALLAACSTGVDKDTALPTTSSTEDTQGPTTSDTDTAPVGVAALGAGTHDAANVSETTIATSADGLYVPRDLEFNPYVDGEIWVVNRADDSVTILSDAMGDPSSRHVIDPYALHFMEEVSSIAFGEATFGPSDYPTFATCQESQNTYNGQGPPNSFMGPTLWSSDPDVFGFSNPDAVAYVSELYGFYADLGSHLDMLHESPDCMGIAWEDGNAYWVFDGYYGSIVRYDFLEDHGVGYDYHDGTAARYVTGEINRVAGVPSHLVLDHSTGFLYIADTGSASIKVLDTTSGTRGANMPTWEPATEQWEMLDADIWTLVDGEAYGLEQPSGIALVDGLILVTDHATGIVHAFDQDGAQVDWFDTGRGAGALMGIEAAGLDDIWLVDADADEVFRLQPAQ